MNMKTSQYRFVSGAERAERGKERVREPCCEHQRHISFGGSVAGSILFSSNLVRMAASYPLMTLAGECLKLPVARVMMNTAFNEAY